MKSFKKGEKKHKGPEKSKTIPIIPCLVTILVILIMFLANAIFLILVRGDVIATTAKPIIEVAVADANKTDNINSYYTVTVKNYNQNDEVSEVSFEYQIFVNSIDGSDLPEYTWYDSFGNDMGTDLTGTFFHSNKQDQIYTICFKNAGTQDVLQNIKIESKAKQKDPNAVDVKVGDTITYSPSGTYDWDAAYATADTTGTTTLSSGAGQSYNISTWKVLSVDKSTGNIQMVPASPTTGTVTLQGAQGYNNAVYLLNNACSSLYGNASKGITARSITEEDFAEIGGTTWTNYRAAYKGTVKYGSQYTSAYTTNRYYPTIYAQEKNSVINGTKSTTGYSQSEQTSLIERADSSATNGRLQASTSIQPYQTYYNTKDYTTTANLLGGYGSILLPKGSSTQYWVASRCVILNLSNCGFNVHGVYSGYLGTNGMLYSDSYADGYARSLFPVVSLSSELLETTATDGTYNVK